MSTSPTLLIDTRSAVHSTTAAPSSTSTETTTTGSAEVTTATAATAVSDDWTVGQDNIEDNMSVGQDVTAELSAPVAVAAGLGHTEWQLLAVAGAGVAVILLLAVVLTYRRTGGGSPALHKVIHHDDAECPPLLDYSPRHLDFAKYLGKSSIYDHITASKSLGPDNVDQVKSNNPTN